MDMLNPLSLLAEQQTLALYIIQAVTSSIIIIFVILILFFYYRYRRIRTFPVELILYICISEFMCNVFQIIPLNETNENSTICLLQSFSEIVFDLQSLIITTFIGILSYISTKHENIYKQRRITLRLLILIIPFTISLIFGLV